MSKLFEGLNEAQRRAVEHLEGPSLVIAGAGSGKTRVLTYRVAYLLEKGVPPSSVMALTFTNKAAREMRERIDLLLGNNTARYIWMGTFHSMFARILRKEGDRLGFPSAFTIYDTDDSRSLLKSIIRELQLDEKIYKPAEVLGRISSAKNNLITAQAYYNHPGIRERDKITRRPLMGDIYKMYAARCKRAGAMDFDDLLLYTNILFRDFPEVLRTYQEKFKYLLVDEYQDTNYAQYLIVKKLGETHHNVCVVGDDAQSIYSFRGAKIENILNFQKDYPSYTLFKLEQNYRSTKMIVSAGNSIIEKNKDQIKKKIYSKNDEGEKVNVIKALTDVEEGFMISNSILDTSLRDRLPYSDFAILYRTNAQSRIFEEALRKRNIPYRVYGSISFYQRKEIKDIIAYLRLLVNPNDNEALKRVINYPARGIGKTTVGKLEEASNLSEKSIWEILHDPGSPSLEYNRGTISKLNAFTDFIRKFQDKVDKLDAYAIAHQLATESGILKELYQGNTPEERSKFENLEELLNGIQDFVEAAREEAESTSLASYLENIALLTDADTDTDENKNRVSIMTMHSAKGLEFGCVYVAGVEEELFPSPMSLDNPENLEEERRLFYVAVTRAKKRVTVSYSQSRYRWGELVNCSPSRFISEIDDNLVYWPDDPRKSMIPGEAENSRTIYQNEWSRRKQSVFNNPTPTRLVPGGFPGKPSQKLHDPNFKPSDPASIQSGMLVEHQRFGKGKVIQIEGEMPNKKATVFFQEMKQEKQLLLKFAKLRIIELT